MTIRFRLGEFNNNVVSALIDLDRLKSKQMLNNYYFFFNTSFTIGRHSPFMFLFF